MTDTPTPEPEEPMIVCPGPPPAGHTGENWTQLGWTSKDGLSVDDSLPDAETIRTISPTRTVTAKIVVVCPDVLDLLFGRPRKYRPTIMPLPSQYIRRDQVKWAVPRP